MNIAEFEQWSLVICTTGLVAYMAFIIYRLAYESKAPRFGYFVLFFSLGLGVIGYIIKTVLVEWLQV